LIQSAEAFGKSIGVQAACAALIVPRSSLYRARTSQTVRVSPKISARALNQAEKIKVREELNSERFPDRSPREVYATLIDEGRYLCSWRSMYRILDENHEVRERRDQLRHPNYVKPELLATNPNQLWSWDTPALHQTQCSAGVTKLLGPTKWTYFYLYVILDVFSRYVVSWMIAERESAVLAEELISQTCVRQGIQRGQLTVHADRGSAMTSKPVALLLADLGVTKTHSRPHVSNNNPYSEAHFTPALAGGARETLKYRPDYPTRFGCLQDARAWAAEFFDWYNREHHHTGLALLTPADVHFHRVEDVLQKRQAVLQAAYEKTPERFVKGVPHPIQLPKAVWINPPTSTTSAFIEHPARNENENSHCKSAVPVLFGAMPILHEVCLETSLSFSSD
jgi:putative transposase